MVYTAILGATVFGFVLAFIIGQLSPVLAGLGLVAYAFGLRHGVDADHIAAIDNTTRKLRQEGKRPFTLGMWFSLAHSAIVFVLIGKPWHIFPVGVLFGLGFDTATEVALIAISVGVGVSSAVPIWMILILPLMFTCGMVLVDTSDGVVMRSAYGWAFVNPIRKVYYNLTVTIVSVIVAFGIGGIEILSLLAPRMGLTRPFLGSLADLNFETMGGAIIVLFVVAWTVSVAYWKYKRFDERFPSSGGT